MYLDWLSSILDWVSSGLSSCHLYLVWISCIIRGRNNLTISGSQQDYLVGKSGSPQMYVVVIWPRFKENTMTNKKFDKYSQYFW